MKASRLLSALMLLQARGRISTRELAERLQVSTRTAHRDMESLSEAGVPVVAFRGVHGGWELSRDWRTRVPALDEPELRALLMAQAGAPGAPRIAAAAGRALEKLMAAMPALMQKQAVSIRSRIHVDPEGWGPASDDVSALPIVQDAVVRDLRLSFRYMRPGAEPSTKKVDPLGLVSKQGIWYLVARATEGIRTYRVSRMTEAAVLPVPFVRPTFDLGAWWRESTAKLAKQRPSFTATLALSPEAVASVSGWRRVLPVRNPPRLRPLLAPGWTVLNVEFESDGQARFVALGLASDARVLRPGRLRKDVLAAAEEIVARSRRRA